MSFLSDWVAKLEEGHTITWGDSIVLQRVQMSLLNADKHHRQAREGQTMQELLEREVERQQGEITRLYRTIAHQERQIRHLHDALVIAEGQRDQARAERDALRENWSGLLIEQARLMALRDDAIAERDALRKDAGVVCQP